MEYPKYSQQTWALTILVVALLATLRAVMSH